MLAEHHPEEADVHSRLRNALTFAALAIAFVALGEPHGTNAAYPGTNGRIAYVEREGQSDLHIWTMNPDGTDKDQLTTGAVRDEQPRYSPDGTMIAFHRYIPDNNIWLMNADGSDLHKIPNTDGGYSLTWSPDGTKIVFEDNIGGVTDLAVIGINGSGYVNLTDSDTFEAFPDWSPNGEKIVFQRAEIQIDVTELWMMDANGSNQEQLTTSPTIGEGYPDWSPDGTQIVYAANESANDGDIFIIDATGGTPENLTESDPIERRPVFSPDGQSIAYDVGAETLPAGGPPLNLIMIMNLDTRDSHNISTGTAPVDFGPDWSVGAAALVWGDHDCAGGIDPFDALIDFRKSAGIEPAVPAGTTCALLGDTLATPGFGDLTWGDIDCDGTIDGDDAVLILRHVVGLEPANLQDCPAIGVAIPQER
jgi:TolB protein